MQLLWMALVALLTASTVFSDPLNCDLTAYAASDGLTATVEQDLGNLDAARTLLQRAIEIDEKAYEADHPSLAIRYSNLALVEQDLGNLDVARKFARRAYEIASARLGPDHPTTGLRV